MLENIQYVHFIKYICNYLIRSETFTIDNIPRCKSENSSRPEIKTAVKYNQFWSKHLRNCIKDIDMISNSHHRLIHQPKTRAVSNVHTHPGNLSGEHISQ